MVIQKFILKDNTLLFSDYYRITMQECACNMLIVYNKRQVYSENLPTISKTNFSFDSRNSLGVMI